MVCKQRRKKIRREAIPATRPNQRWATDYVSDGLAGGRKIRALTIADTYARECLAMGSRYEFAGPEVRRVLEQLMQQRLRPEEIRVDNVLNARTCFAGGQNGSHAAAGARSED